MDLPVVFFVYRLLVYSEKILSRAKNNLFNFENDRFVDIHLIENKVAGLPWGQNSIHPRGCEWELHKLMQIGAGVISLAAMHLALSMLIYGVCNYM